LLVLASAPLVLTAIALISALICWVGLPLYFQERVGEGGRTFRLVKLPTMRVGSELCTGPTLADKSPGSALIREVARARAGGVRRRARAVLGLGVAGGTRLGTLSLVGTAICWPWLARLYHLDGLASQARTAALLMLAGFLLDGLVMPRRAVLARIGRYTSTARVDGASAVVGAVPAIAAVRLNGGLTGLAAIVLVSGGLRAVMPMYSARRDAADLMPSLTARSAKGVRQSENPEWSPAMVGSYFEYMTIEYPAGGEHGMLPAQLHGTRCGAPLSRDATRSVLLWAGAWLKLGRIKTYQFRRSFATAVLDTSGVNSIYATDAGGRASAVTVEETCGHADVHDPDFAAALERSWEMS